MMVVNVVGKFRPKQLAERAYPYGFNKYCSRIVLLCPGLGGLRLGSSALDTY